MSIIDILTGSRMAGAVSGWAAAVATVAEVSMGAGQGPVAVGTATRGKSEVEVEA